MHGSLLEDYPSYKRAEHHGMFVSEDVVKMDGFPGGFCTGQTQMGVS